MMRPTKDSQYYSKLDKLFWIVFGISIMSSLSWAAWVTKMASEAVTQDETVFLIDSHAPYVEDRKMIARTMDEARETNLKLADAIENNTKALIEVKTVLEERQR